MTNQKQTVDIEEREDSLPISMLRIVWDIGEYGSIYVEQNHIVLMDFSVSSEKENLLVNGFGVWLVLSSFDVVGCSLYTLFGNGFKAEDVFCFHGKSPTGASYVAVTRTIAITGWQSEREASEGSAMALRCHQNCSNQEHHQLHILTASSLSQLTLASSSSRVCFLI